LAHPITADLLRGRITVDHLLVEGDELKGSAADTDVWRVMHTPGHASGHIVLWNEVLELLVGGDMVAQVGTILIQPPDGHMATYLRELSRLRDLAPRWLVPAHGEVIDRPVEHLEYYISHRLGREAKVLGNLTEGAQDLSAITAASYDDVPKALHVLARGSTLAHLIKLEEEGKARRVDDSWRIGPGA
jgi:glyoxylase-like metal-dependent hydrolase (beta-lactamase superfamily II)